MSKFVFLSFAFLAWVFYEMSGGADFVPRKAEVIAAAEAARAAEAAERAERVAARTLPPSGQDAVVSQVALRTAPKAEPVAASPTPVERDGPAEIAQAQLPQQTATLISLEQSSTLFARPLLQLQEQAQEQPVATPQQAEADIREVSGTRVNMRSGPGTAYAVLISLPQGTPVRVIDNNGDGWVKLRLVDSGETGWMAEYLLTEPTG